MNPEFDDLIPLFVSEARERLDRFATLAPRLGEDPAAVAEAKRELHTLKGAGRMLQLPALSDLCHAAEGALGSPGPETGRLMTEASDALAAMVDAIARGETPNLPAALVGALEAAASGPAAAPPAGAANEPRESPSDATAEAPAPAVSTDVRIGSAAMDTMTERATRIRILAQGAEAINERLHELARLADRGVYEPHPEQVLAVLSASLRSLAVWVEGGQRRLRRAADMQLEGTLALQLQPLRGALLSLARHARELARSLGREVTVETAGEDTRLDRRIARELETALLHAVRNAVDHGIEPPEARRAAGKAATGTIRLAAVAAGRNVRLTIADDGAGIDPAAIARAAVARGLLDRDAARSLSDQEALQLVFRPGFSTRSKASDVSGRGVGLDAVAAAVHRIGGRVELDTAPGKGTAVLLEVPLARRGEQLLVLRVGALRVALLKGWVCEVGILRPEDLVERSGRSLVRRDQRLVPLAPLARLLGEPAAARQLLLLGEVAGQPLAVAADKVEGEVEAIVRAAPKRGRAGDLVEGFALLPSGEPVVVLSTPALARPELASRTVRKAVAVQARPLSVLLVDDSLVTREMERRLLEDAGFLVVTAGDAGEALSRLGESRYDCLIADVEMPGMDGLELTRTTRSLPQLAQLPVVVVSTRDRPEDRLAALEAGADAYLSKKKLDAAELVALVRRLGGAH